MTWFLVGWFLVGLAVGLLANWVYCRACRALLGDRKWRERALAKLSHDEFLELNGAFNVEYNRRFREEKAA